MLLNGLSYIYGPCLARVGNMGILNMSEADIFLQNMQQNIYNHPYVIYGDSIFRNKVFIISKHVTHSNIPLGNNLRVQNRSISSVYVLIEWSYLLNTNLFKICTLNNYNKLLREKNYFLEQLCTSYLLVNIYTCLNYSLIGAISMFDFIPPLLKEYLVPN